MSCPKLGFDYMRQCEYCKITDAKVEMSLMCDFDYDECPDYKKHESADKQKKLAHTK